jgi:hypothetical protein
VSVEWSIVRGVSFVSDLPYWKIISLLLGFHCSLIVALDCIGSVRGGLI